MSNLCKWRFFHPYFDIRITRTAELWPLRAGHLYLHEIPWYLFLLKAGWAPGLMNSDRKNRSLEDFQESLVHIFLSTFMYFLYIFRATMCPSSGETTVFMWHLVLVILYGLLSGIQSGTNTGMHGQQNIIFQESYRESKPKPPVLWRSASKKLAKARPTLGGDLKWFPAAQSINTNRRPPTIIM